MAELPSEHRSLWNSLMPLLLADRIPQSMLFLGQTHTQKSLFVRHFVAAALCQKRGVSPCGQCHSCLLNEETHPDVMYLKPEGQDKGIKAEQIRGLQQEIYQTPKCSSQRFIIIEPADRLNNFAANALLKMIEEPPSHTVFILLAEQTSSLLPTILSRCQRFNFPSPTLPHYLDLGAYYEENSPRFTLMQQQEAIIEALCDVLEEKISVCGLAAQWATYPLEDLLWALYLLNAEAIATALGTTPTHPKSRGLLHRFCTLTTPMLLFSQLDKINVLLRKITHNINMNTSLALEDFLLGYLRMTNGR